MTLPVPAEERRPCGVAGGLTWEYWPYPITEPTPPDISDIRVFRQKPWRLILWEPLPTKAPGPHLVQPWCCYVNTVIFYAYPYQELPPTRYLSWHEMVGHQTVRLARPVIKKNEVGEFAEYDRIETRLGFDGLVRFEGEVYETGGARIRYARPYWYSCVWARRRQQDPVEAAK